MPRAAAMVGHGGSGGTLSALAAGVPLALLPQFVDGPANAIRVAELGAGIVMADVATATATSCALIAPYDYKIRANSSHAKRQGPRNAKRGARGPVAAAVH